MPRLDSYAGMLKAAEIAEGMNAAVRNAARLVGDAQMLVEEARYPSAASLAALAIEESGKVSILRGLAAASNQKEAAAHWKAYRRHTEKNRAWILPDLVSKGARQLDELIGIFDGASEHPDMLDHVKQLGFYTDCLGKRHWSQPSEVIDQSLAAELVARAKLLTPTREVTIREVELWIKHMKGLANQQPAWRRAALMNFYRECNEEGVLAEDLQVVEDFLGL